MKRNAKSLTHPVLGLILMTAYIVLSSKLAVVGQETGGLSRITTKGQTYIASHVEFKEDRVSFLDVDSLSQRILAKSDVVTYVPQISPDEAARFVGIPRMVAWAVTRLTRSRSELGKIAKITPQTYYTTLGDNCGVSENDVLNVYRLKGIVTDPDTGEELGTERAKIAELEVTEVSDSLSKARLRGRFEVELSIGDVVEIASPVTIAVCPMQLQDGTITTAGMELTDAVTNALVQAKASVVERNLLANSLEELLLQTTTLIDSDTTVKLGKLTGANYVVIGRIVSRGNGGTAYLRVVDVSSSQVYFSVSGFHSLRDSTTVSSFEELMGEETAVRAAASATVFRGSYSSEQLAEQSAIQIEQDIQDDYEFSLKFEKIGKDALIIMLPVGRSNVQLVIDQDLGALSGLSLVNGEDASINETRSDASARTGENILEVSVRRSASRCAITAVLNGEEFVVWRGTTDALSSPPEWIPPDRSKIGIGTTNCRVKIGNVVFGK